MSWRDQIDEEKAFLCKWCKGNGIMGADYDFDEDGNLVTLGAEPCVCQDHLLGSPKEDFTYKEVA